MVEIDTGKPLPARMYGWYLGGKDNYLADEAMGHRCSPSTRGCR